MKLTGNATFDLYASGGDLVDQCNKEIEAAMQIGQRKRLVETTDEYVLFVSTLMALNENMGATLKDVLVASAACKRQLSAMDTKLISNLHVMFTTSIDRKALKKITLHFARKIARTPLLPVETNVRRDGADIVIDFANGDSEVHRYKNESDAILALRARTNE